MGRVYAKLMLGKNWKKYIPVILLILIQCQLFQNHIVGYGRIMKHSYDIAIGDHIADFYKGTLPFTMRGDSEPFNIPAIWSLYFIYFFVVIGQAVSQLSHNYEVQMAMRCVSRRRWWKYQNLVLWLESIGYLIVTYITFGIYGLCTGVKIEVFHLELQRVYNNIDLSGCQNGSFLVVILVNILLVMMAFAYIQYVISLKGNPLIGILVSVVILVVSVFYLHPLLLGNYLMLIRQDKVMTGGVKPEIGIIISMSVIAVSALIAKRIVDKKDLF